MHHSSVRRAIALTGIVTALSALAACGDDPARPTGPVTIRFITLPYYNDPNPNESDTARGIALVRFDDGAEMEVESGDSLTNVARGRHTLTVRYDIDYLPGEFEIDINPNSNRLDVFLPQEATCRSYLVDFDESGSTSFCSPSIGGRAVRKNILDFTNERLVCSANDFGEFCSTVPDNNQLGGTWPETGIQQYIAHAKLLVAATVPSGAGTTNLAMSLYNPGDYSPRSRLQPITATDSTRYLNEVWTDARHIPIYFEPGAAPRTALAFNDRNLANFGLSVTNRYYQSANFRDVIFVRFDVKNVSAEADFRRVHPEVPAGGQTIANVYLTPTVDFALGINRTETAGETSDDNATVFPQENLIAAYDQGFLVSYPGVNGGVTVNNAPGLVGLQFISGPAGATPRAILLDRADSLSFRTTDLEAATHRYLTAGRGGAQTGCTLRGADVAFVCSSESPTDIVGGWSVGPIASLPPGQTVSVTIAIMIATPRAGTYTSGSSYSPENAGIGDNSRTIAQIAQDLRALAQQTAGVAVP